MATSRAEAERQHDRKLEQEKAFSPKALALLNTMTADFEKEFAASGRLINAEDYHNDWLTLLNDEYQMLTGEWGNMLTDEEESKLDEALAAVIIASGLGVDEVLRSFQNVKNERLNRFALSSSIEHARDITNTNNVELSNALSSAIEDLVDLNEELSDAIVARTAASKLRETNQWRADTIAATEVNNGAEGSKNIEAESINDVLAVTIATARIKKQWHTMGDAKVRPAHQAANLQIVDINEQFIVGGEELRFPADPRGSAGNTINCRCTALQFVG